MKEFHQNTKTFYYTMLKKSIYRIGKTTHQNLKTLNVNHRNQNK